VKEPLRVKFAVLPDGRVDRFSMLTGGVPAELVDLVRQAVESCAWTPAKNASGQPVAAWVIVPLRLARAGSE
jgi:hypothetical protein